ncbi:hypothetical protein BKA65DRAFT_500616 [Rhexocercosporidium sp. MPI-PUGE-AT-0058]|nr:hypothetical protein BKA65DRAFT_500616 [Rhexocercosporidium sp. MPI-PUGE-AT-0058]
MKYEDFKIKSKAPSHIKSVFVDPKDIEMASRQIKMTSLPPRERTKQEEWAQKMIQKVGNCPQDLPWNRIEEYNGYQCTGLGHFITDELIAEGKCGIMKTKSRDPRTLWGPYCPDPKNRKKFDFYDLREKPTYLAPDGWVMDEEPGDQEFWMRDDGSVFRSRMILDPNTLWYAIKYGEEPKVGGGEE